MGRKKKRNIYIIVFICLIGIFIGYKLVNKPYYKILNSNWNKNLPGSYTEVYKSNSESFLGDGERYHIFKYDSDIKIEKYLNFNNGKNSNAEVYIQSKLNKMNIPTEYIPQFDKGYEYFIEQKDDSSVIYMIYFSEDHKLYILEDIY